MSQSEISQTTTLCDEHGRLKYAFICRHLRRGKKRGFFAMIDDTDPSTKQGQCFRCGMVSLVIGSIPFIGYRLWVWYSRPELVCSECFDQIRLKNARGTKMEF
ncbi:MAG TPA: hypothetical protein VIF82_17955 [Burkholderiaceae bacterium]|jgi:hypothetical protein